MAYSSFSKCSSDTGGISVKNLCVSVPGKDLLKDVNLKIAYKKRYALVAPNGAGKTTLIQLISSREIPISEKISIVGVDQILEKTQKSCMSYVMDADAKHKRLLDKEERILQAIESEEITDEADLEELLEALGQVQIELDDRNESEMRASKILHGLGFTEEMKTGSASTLSGGWRMRLSLARALVMLPDILLLDEPTNHLDLRAVVWLENYLQTWKRTVIVITHDKDFIDNAATDILTIVNKQLIHVRGCYDDLIVILQQQQAQTAPKKGRISTPPAIHFDFGDCEYELPPSGSIQVSEVSFGYTKDNYVIHDLDMCINNASRVAVLGLNGSGKSTILKLISGELQPVKGEVKRHQKLRVACYGQHTVDDLATDQTSIGYLSGRHTNMDLTGLHKTLSLFGLAAVDRNRPLSNISGGQRSRVVLADIYLLKPHILILDEPTNHLDIVSIEALTKAIRAFPGGVILASHNSQLLRAVTGDLERSEVWSVESGRIFLEKQTYAEYRKKMLNDYT